MDEALIRPQRAVRHRRERTGLRPKDCFVLGVEWQMVTEELDRSEDATGRPIHSANVERIKRLCIRRRRRFRVTGPAVEGWHHIEIASASGEFRGE